MTDSDLSAAAITDGLSTAFVGQRTLYYPRLATTMEAARQEAERGAPEGTVVIAGEQTAARGRLRRVWLSPRGNVALSIILRPTKERLPALTMVAALAAASAIEAVTGLRPELKWPNDVLLKGRKVCGILIETHLGPERPGYAIVGIGINVNLNVDDFPEIREIATSLSHEAGCEVSRLALVRRLLAETERLYLESATGDSVFKEWRSRLVTLGRAVRVTAASGQATFEGIAESVARDGTLMLRRPDGSLMPVLAGDVTLREE